MGIENSYIFNEIDSIDLIINNYKSKRIDAKRILTKLKNNKD
jgi:hypothetical protein